MNNHRMGARGNATSFPLPWEDLFKQLQSTGSTGQASEGPDVPRSGKELSNFVSVLLKTSDDGDDKECLARFVHQALVRRDVVVRLIVEMKNAGTGHTITWILRECVRKRSVRCQRAPYHRR